MLIGSMLVVAQEAPKKKKMEQKSNTTKPKQDPKLLKKAVVKDSTQVIQEPIPRSRERECLGCGLG